MLISLSNILLVLELTEFLIRPPFIVQPPLLHLPPSYSSSRLRIFSHFGCCMVVESGIQPTSRNESGLNPILVIMAPRSSSALVLAVLLLVVALCRRAEARSLLQKTNSIEGEEGRRELAKCKAPLTLQLPLLCPQLPLPSSLQLTQSGVVHFPHFFGC